MHILVVDRASFSHLFVSLRREISLVCLFLVLSLFVAISTTCESVEKGVYSFFICGVSRKSSQKIHLRHFDTTAPQRIYSFTSLHFISSDCSQKPRIYTMTTQLWRRTTLRLVVALLSFLTLVSGLSSISSRKIAIVGATGRLGRTAVTKLATQGIPMKCLIRQESPPDFLEELARKNNNIEFIQGDVTNLNSVKELLTDCTECLALYGATRRSSISDLWAADNGESSDGHAKLVNYGGVQNLIDAAAATASCQRIVRITGKGEDPTSIFSILINMLGSMAKGWNYEGEQLLRTSSIDYTIIRPGIMKPQESMKVDSSNSKKVLALKDDGGDLKVTPVSYENIADLCIECLDYPNAARATLTAMNVPPGEGQETYGPLLEQVKADSREFPVSLIEEHKKAVRDTVTKLLIGATSILMIGILSLVFL